MKIFITGGTGFIGTPLVKKLESEENEILLLIHESEDKSLSNISKKIRTISGNLSNINSWKEEVNNFKPDAVIHMAWEGLPNYDSETSIKNLKYGLNLIKMLAQIGCKLFMSTGSCWEYGQQTGELKEDDTLKPFSAFSAAKNCLHWSGREIAQENDMVFVWTRLFYVYGPGQKENSLIPYIIKCIKKKKKPEINAPSAKNDFIYVEDVADAISMIIKNCKKSKTYNIGSGKSTSVQEIVKTICDYYDFKFELENQTDDKKNDTKINFWADISKIRKEIGWKPKTDIKEGIKKMIFYYEKKKNK